MGFCGQKGRKNTRKNPFKNRHKTFGQIASQKGMLLNAEEPNKTVYLVSVLVASSLLAGILFAASQETGIIGYIDDSRFHPLVLVTPTQITQADSTKLHLTGQLRNAFRTTAEIFFIQKQENYVDPFGPDKPGSYAVIKGNISDIQNFYTPQLSVFPSLPRNSYSAEIRSFYDFFSHDKWGQHFVSRDLLNKPLDEIARKTDVRIHVVTDINHNSLLELWITYKLSHGEIGRIVYEQASDRLLWRLIANHCYMCD